ncbi:MAG: ATP-binding protein, partial [Pedobacter sp.]|nr:ATP-binding protein [Pedobacter sp.]
DVHSTPAALVTDGKAVPLDLTHSTLRAVSPIHIQYLKNMGVASSFSVSIMDHGKLWGLIACHNYTPRFINFRERESAKLVGQVLSSAISFREQEEDQHHAVGHRQAVETITRYLLRNIAVEDALINQDYNLKDVLDCKGAAFYFENTLHVTGDVPDEEFIYKLIKWLDEKTYADGYYMSPRLSEDFDLAKHHRLNASGLLACRMGKDLNEYMLWFRPEVKSTVKWAGKPEKIQQVNEKGILHISPRNSFQEWSEQVELTSLAWKKHELDAALSLRDEVNYAISRKATELRIINEKLREAYAELDTFSYTISHDLKNPLATIRSYAQLIKRGLMDTEKNISMAERIEKGTEKMQAMIDEVLAYSKAGQARLETKAINMQRLLEELRHDLLVSANNPNLKIEIKESPEIYGDEMMILQVFSNLMGNAVKYSKKSVPSLVSVTGIKSDNEVVYAIEDNGIGIPKDQHTSIFELFARATASNEFEGSGVGLSIVKRILEKHNGNIWLDSQPGRGSVFFVSFKRYDSLHQLN